MQYPLDSTFSAVNGIYQNTVYGLAAKLPFKYTGAVVLGSVSAIEFECVHDKSFSLRL